MLLKFHIPNETEVQSNKVTANYKMKTGPHLDMTWDWGVEDFVGLSMSGA